MARQQPVTRKQSRSKRDTQQKADPVEDQNGHGEEVAKYEQELASLLQERIKPGLNRGAIPLLARSIAKDIAHRDPPSSASENTGGEEEHSDKAEDEQSDRSESPPEFEAERSGRPASAFVEQFDRLHEH